MTISVAEDSIAARSCSYGKNCLHAVVARGLCIKHYQHERLAGRLALYPKVLVTKTPSLFADRVTVVVYMERTLLEQIDAIVAARTRQEVKPKEGASLAAVCRELLAAGLGTGRVK